MSGGDEVQVPLAAAFSWPAVFRRESWYVPAWSAIVLSWPLAFAAITAARSELALPSAADASGLNVDGSRRHSSASTTGALRGRAGPSNGGNGATSVS